MCTNMTHRAAYVVFFSLVHNCIDLSLLFASHFHFIIALLSSRTFSKLSIHNNKSDEFIMRCIIYYFTRLVHVNTHIWLLHQCIVRLIVVFFSSFFIDQYGNSNTIQTRCNVLSRCMFFFFSFLQFLTDWEFHWAWSSISSSSSIEFVQILLVTVNKSQGIYRYHHKFIWYT